MRLCQPCIIALLIMIAGSSTWGDTDTVDHIRFIDPAGYSGTDTEPIEYVWRYGDRSMNLRGVALKNKDSELLFSLQCKTGKNLTVEIREFRTGDDQSPAYMALIDGSRIAFRCRGYDGPGPASAFIDLPDCYDNKRIEIKIINIATAPLCFSEVFLYEDIEGFAREKDLVQPMYVGTTVGGEPTSTRLMEIRSLIPDNDTIKPMCTLSTLAIANLSPEDLAEQLDSIIKACHEADLPIEIHLNTWWAGTPNGCDTKGGTWYDPEYQQVLYDQETGRYFLSTPNRWANTPWLTTRHPELNNFKANKFRIAGQLLREKWDAYQSEAGYCLPIMSLVIDNEVTYWGFAGFGGALVDVNPWMIKAAAAEGITLNAEDGFSAAEYAFLRESLRVYNREMATATLEGLGDCPLAERVYTHTWAGGCIFENPYQALQAGTLNAVKLGVECNFKDSFDFTHMDIAREIGVPASINIEVGGLNFPAPEIPFAYATGCSRAVVFNASKELLQSTFEKDVEEWPSYQPVPWRPVVFSIDFKDEERWRRYFTTEKVAATVYDGLHDPMLRGMNLGTSNKTQLHLKASDIVGKDAFDRLAFHFEGRAFVFLEMNDDAYLSIGVGKSPEKITEVKRLMNMAGQVEMDITPYIKGATDIYIEFTFHPLVDVGWVGMLRFELTIPWEEERLLSCNRSYHPERLRAESMIVGWRAEATWALRRCEMLKPVIPGMYLEEIRGLIAGYDYRNAYRKAAALLSSHKPDTYKPFTPQSQNRTEIGRIHRAERGFIVLDPYAYGYTNKKIPVADDADIRFILNGEETKRDDTTFVKWGDAVTAEVKDNRAVRVIIKRNELTVRIEKFVPATAFSLAEIEIEGYGTLLMDPRAHYTDRAGEKSPQNVSLQIDKRLYEPGDKIHIRWNPDIKRIFEVTYVSHGKK